ncbi:MAG: 50S ribosomal protein L25 [Anaerolineae bacterium]|nr:MAG: 50S ribosomal protein L25 [Anaerolineae bacterium]
MSDQYVLEANRREVTGKKVKRLRREGKLPGILYGHKVEPTPVVVDYRTAAKVLRDVGTSTLLTLKLDGKEYPVLVREQQVDVLSRQLLHVDFQALAMDETVRTQVDVVVLDENVPAVKNYSAILTVVLDSVEIECLPKDLPENITVDASVLQEIGDTITVADLNVPAGVTVLEDPESVVVVATAPESAAEEEAEAEAEEGVEPEVIEKGKGEEEAEE